MEGAREKFARIDGEVHRRAKVAAAERGVSMSELVTEAVRQYLDRQEREE